MTMLRLIRPLLVAGFLLAALLLMTELARAQAHGHQDEDTAAAVAPSVSSPLTNTVTLTSMAGGTLDFGLSQFPQEKWCGSSGLTATIKGIMPQYLAAQLRIAAACGFSLLPVIPRPLETSNGQLVGRWSVDACKHAIELYRTAVPPSAWATYVANGTIIGLNIGDDYGSAPSWGGAVVTQSSVAACTIYAKIRLGPAVPIGVRVPASWVRQYGGWNKSLDYVWAQYRTMMGRPDIWFAKQASDAAAIGLKLAGGVNITDCDKAGTNRACTAAELRQFVAIPINDPRYCAVLSWMYDWAYNDPARHAVWAELTALAKTKPARSCHL